MRATCALVIGIGLVVTAGCTKVHHRYEPYQAIGRPIPIEVSIKHKSDEPISGTVYHRSAGRFNYKATRLQARGEQLWAMVPTDGLQPDDTVEYYLDVVKDGRLTTLGTPGAPYVVTVLDQAGMVRNSLRDYPVASDSAHAVAIVLSAHRQPIEQPTALYQMPGVPGDVRAPMEADGHGNYKIVIPPAAVSPGTWRYAIEVPYNGQVFRLPEQGYRSFVVVEPVHVYESNAHGAH